MFPSENWPVILLIKGKVRQTQLVSRTVNLMMASEQAETCRFINTNKIVVFDVPHPSLTAVLYVAFFACIFKTES